MISRAERGPVADWFRSIDRWLLGSFGALMVIGVVKLLPEQVYFSIVVFNSSVRVWQPTMVPATLSMKQQAVELHGYRPEDVFVTGTPHWDVYFRGTRGPTRDMFFRRIGADPSRKLVTLTTTPFDATTTRSIEKPVTSSRRPSLSRSRTRAPSLPRSSSWS